MSMVDVVGAGERVKACERKARKKNERIGVCKDRNQWRLSWASSALKVRFYIDVGQLLSPHGILTKQLVCLNPWF